MILAKEQRIGAAILLGIALIVWIVMAFMQAEPIEAPETAPHKPSWEERKDSIRRADSLRYARWSEEREQRYDSFRFVDSARRAEWKRVRQQQYDSLRIADSLWRDSVGLRKVLHEKKDTIIDLNRCDTADLQYIRGIGAYTAARIIRYREQLGGFYSPAQLTDEALSGLHLDTLLHHFTANADDVQPLPVNSCSAERLQRHPYLRYNQAKAIYALRRKNVHLHAIDDLRSLDELTEEELIRLAPYLSFE